ncbi:unnamed protein product [Owenia fusiformis]|uniref:Uncharacterized protein n=1 Tax=Owenia fusiformis TaxID=6347 RepID=A0A8J1XRG7_OWEFU|nr:unnamed protein product [Owenia fusiformis]
MTDVLPCAPTSNMARYDRRYERVTSDISRFHPGASVCYVAKEITNAGVQQECCYDSECKLMVGPGAGTANRAAGSYFSRSEHYRIDIYPYIKCCEETSNDPDLCGKYNDRRPSNNGTNYSPPPKHNITVEIITCAGLESPNPE